VLIIHVPDMNNKGSVALLRSDISVIREVVKGDVFLSVSAVDVSAVRKLNLPLDAVLPTLVDIPYKTADSLAKKSGIARYTFKYKVLMIASFIYMFVQTTLAVISALLTRLGLRAFYRNEVLTSMKKSKLVISCSDELFKEVASLLPLSISWMLTYWSMLYQRTLEVSIAKFIGKPIVLFPNSVGPFRTWVGRFLCNMALNNCEYVLVREPVSYEIVNSLGIKSHKILTADMALLFKPTQEIILETFPHPAVGVCPGIYSNSLSSEGVNNYILEHARALDAAIDKYGFNVVFLPHYVSGFEYDDLEISELILRQMKNKDHARIVNADNIDEFKSSLNHMDMIITSKMHPGVLGVSGYVPTLSIAYDHKQTGFFRQLGMADCAIHINDASSEVIMSKIDFIWKERKRIAASLRTRIPELQEGIKMAVREALASFVPIDDEPVN
jgi:colanic acid/amylovoran biosynthesis protein